MQADRCSAAQMTRMATLNNLILTGGTNISLTSVFKETATQLEFTVKTDRTELWMALLITTKPTTYVVWVSLSVCRRRAEETVAEEFHG